MADNMTPLGDLVLFLRDKAGLGLTTGAAMNLAYALADNPEVVLRALGGSKVGEWTHPTPYSEWRFMEAK